MVSKNINYYLSKPEKLLEKKPFVRGGNFLENIETLVGVNQKFEVKSSQLVMREISQDQYRCEYNPSLHKILYNKSIPRIAVRIGDRTEVIEDLVLTLPLQKNIHNIHTLHLTANPMEFTMYKRKYTTADSESFIHFKEQWLLRDMENIKREAVSAQKSTGDVAVLFRLDKNTKKGKTTVISYKDGKTIIPNYNEYGEEISYTIRYTIDDDVDVMDVYDDSRWYRFVKGDIDEAGNKNNEWRLTNNELHGYSVCPLVYIRGAVAWEYAQSLSEMLELIANLYAVVVKRFGNFAIFIKGNIDEKTFQSQGATLIVNAPNSDSGDDMKTIEFPKPEGMIDYMNYLKKEISHAASVTFLTPEDVTLGSDTSGTAILLAMKNDIAIATESVTFWSPFCNKMAFLFAEMLGLEEGNIAKYTQLLINARMTVWTPESDSTRIQNVNLLRNLISDKTLREYSPIKAADEEQRWAEQKAYIERKAQLEREQIQEQPKIEREVSNGE